MRVDKGTVKDSSFVLNKAHNSNFAYDNLVKSRNNPIGYKSAGHLVAPFRGNASTRGETFKNGSQTASSFGALLA